jgi:hypothetical protein
MNRTLLVLIVAVFATVMLSGCIWEHDRRGGGGVVMVPPPLPSIVVIEDEPYYYQSGYHYQYRDNSWYYSNAKSGPWEPLPRDHYPKETRFKGKSEGKSQGQGQGQGRDQGREHDQRDRN